MQKSIVYRLSKLLEPCPPPGKKIWLQVFSGKTSYSTSGFPYISQSSFRLFLHHVPHLFQHGLALLDWLAGMEGHLSGSNEFNEREIQSLKRTIQVIRNIVQSAAICAPPDLWILKHVLSVHAHLGLTKLLEPGIYIGREDLAAECKLDSKHLSLDLSLLHCRGYLRHRDGRYALSEIPVVREVYRRAEPILPQFLEDMVDPIVQVLKDRKVSSKTLDLVQHFYKHPVPKVKTEDWRASRFQVEIGYRLVPTVLALHVLKIAKSATQGARIKDQVPAIPSFILQFLQDAGMIRRNAFTQLGARILERGPGPFGIIHAYVPYMRELENKLRGKSVSAWVQRAKNIAASQDANRKTFAMANDSLDRFCSDFNFRYGVFIEHALGQGEATRQRLQRNGEERIQYFGADLEDAAIDRAESLQKEGVLPKNMKFIRRADIANPNIVISAVRSAGCDLQDAVMFVGNGFHEIRGQTNEKIIDVFKSYCDAGILLIFTEESALSDQDLRTTAWNTYHAGFRYVHELSGQGLRPASGTDRFGRHSWKICASLGGYSVLPKYSVHTRTIYPFPRKGGYNPPISMTYFCVPNPLARNLGFYPVSWTPVR